MSFEKKKKCHRNKKQLPLTARFVNFWGTYRDAVLTHLSTLISFITLFFFFLRS